MGGSSKRGGSPPMGVGGVLQGGMGVLQGGIGDPKMRPRGPPRVGGGVLQGRGGRPRRSPGRGPGISCGSSPLRSAVSRTGAPPYRGTSWPGRTGPNRDAPNRKRSGTEGAAAHFRFLRKERSAGRGGGGRGAVRFWRKGGATAHARDADCDITRAGPAALCALYGSAATLCGISASLCGGGVAARMRSEHGTMRVTKP